MAGISPRKERSRPCARDTAKKTWKISSSKWWGKNHELAQYWSGLPQGVSGFAARPPHDHLDLRDSDTSVSAFERRGRVAHSDFDQQGQGRNSTRNDCWWRKLAADCGGLEEGS